MFDPTLYGATLPQRDFLPYGATMPQREVPFTHPFFAQWQHPTIPQREVPLTHPYFAQWQYPTMPQREVPFTHPFFAQWQQQQQQQQHVPWQNYQRFTPPMYPTPELIPQNYFMKEPFYGHKPAPSYFPPMQGLYNTPQFNKWQLPYMY